MKIPSLVSLLVALLIVEASSVDIDQLLTRMSIEEKCGQMTQITFAAFEEAKANEDEVPVNMTKLTELIQKYKVGSFLNTPFDTAQKASLWQKTIKLFQDMALNETNKVHIIRTQRINN